MVDHSGSEVFGREEVNFNSASHAEQEQYSVAANETPVVPAPVVAVNGQANAGGAFAVEKIGSYNAADVKLQFTAEKGKVIELPADAQIEAILVSGDDLIIKEANGDLVLIKGGLKLIPVIHIGSIEIPAEALMASLTAGGVTLPAAGDAAQAGTNQSSGGNFGPDAGHIGDAFHISDLLPFSEFDRHFDDKQLQEGFIVKVNNPPVIIGIDGSGGNGDPLIVQDPSLPDGTQSALPETDTTGVVIVAGSGTVNSLVFGTDLSMVTVAGAGATIVFSFDDPSTGAVENDPNVIYGYVDGTTVPVIKLTVTLDANIAPGAQGTGTVTAEILAPFPHEYGAGGGAIISGLPVVAGDTLGQTSNIALGDLTVIDDVPTAHADTNSVDEGATIHGNVLTDGTDDVFGADGPKTTLPAGGVTGVAVGSDTSAPVAGGLGAAIETTLGFLTLHADGTYDYVSKPNSIDSNAVDHFVYTITDGDGDTSTVTLDIDVAGVTVTATDNDAIVNEAGLSPDGSSAGNGSEIFATGAIIASGGTGPYTYTLNDPAIGIHGTLTLNADGTYTYTLTSPVTEPTADNGADTQSGQESFGYTVTDANGNTVTTGVINVDIIDDMPKAVLTGTSTGTVDEDFLANGINDNAQPGDFAGGSLTATGSITGLFQSGADTPLSYGFNTAGSGPAGLLSGGVAVTYTITANLITAIAGAGNTVFTLSLNATTGDWQFTLVKPLDHSISGTEDDLLLQFGGLITATDKDGDTVTATGALTITVDDDMPKAVIPDRAIVVNGASGAATFDLDFDDVVTGSNYGADGPGNVHFSPSVAGASGLTSGGLPITYSLNLAGTLLTASTTGGTVFTVSLDAATAHYTVTMSGVVDSLSTVDFGSSAYQFNGGNLAWVGFTPVGETITSPIDNNSPDLLLTPFINGVDAGTMNTSSIAGGVGSGNAVDLNEGVRIDFVTDLRGDNAGPGGYGVAGNRDHIFDGHYNTNDASAVFTASGGSVVNLAAFDDIDGNTVVGDDLTPDPITSIIISFGGLSQVIAPTAVATNYTVGGHVYTVTLLADGTVNVGGVNGTSGAGAVGTTIAVHTATGYNSIEYTNVGGENFKIGQFGAAVTTTNPVNLTLPIEIVDGDGDTASSVLGITLVKAGSGITDHSNDGSGVSHIYGIADASHLNIIGSDFADTITGDAANNVLYGGLGADTLNGLGGNDMLIGGDGNDTINLSVDGASDTILFDATAFGDTDTINNFLIGTGATSDVLDLSELFTVTAAGGGVAGFAQLTAGGVLQVDADGGGNSWTNIATLTAVADGSTVSILYHDQDGTDKSGVIS